MLSVLRTLFLAMTGQRFPKKRRALPLSMAQQRALNVGAIMASMRLEYVNCLETQPNKNSGKKSLGDMWGIHDGESAITTLEWLKNEGHSREYDEILLQRFHGGRGGSHECDGERAFDLEAAVMLDDSLKMLTEKQALDTANFVTTKAWDLGRMVNVARWCYGYGFITEEMAWRYVFHAYNEASSIYENWSEFGKAYIVGRAMWDGPTVATEVTIECVERLHSNEKSPWRALALK